MKLLVVSDLHAEDDALDLLKSAVITYEHPIVVLLGDITHNGPVSYAHDVIYDLEVMGIRSYGVVGNMDPPGVLEMLEKAGANIHKKKVDLGNGWSLAGFGGALPGVTHTPTEFTEEEIYAGMSALGIDAKTIVATHAPPAGIAKLDITGKGVGIGSTSIRRIIEEKKPAVLLCGHVHETQGIEKIGETLIVKVGPAYEGKAAVVDLNGKASAELVDI